MKYRLLVYYKSPNSFSVGTPLREIDHLAKKKSKYETFFEACYFILKILRQDYPYKVFTVFLPLTLIIQHTISVFHVLKLSLEQEISFSVAHVNGDSIKIYQSQWLRLLLIL